MKSPLLLGAVLIAACSEPASPLRAAWYPFDNAGDVFRWTENRLPVRYYADTRSNMRDLVQRAIGSWESQFLYGEFRGELVNDSTVADVIVTWGDSVPLDVPPDAGPPVFACDGRTDVPLDNAGTAIDAPIHTQIRIPTAQLYTAAQVSACLRRVTMHELGHTLGLLRKARRKKTSCTRPFR